MARPLRISYPGALYHLTSRGNERRPVFREDADRFHFLRILANTVERFSWACYSYCLMDNHFHLFIETPLANISQGMKHLIGVYTQYFNWKYKRVGHLFQGRFKGILVEKESYFLELCRYIVLNPVRAAMCEDPADYLWSSYRATMGLAPTPAFLTIQPILDHFGSNRQNARVAYERFVLDGIDSRPWERLRGQIYLGSEAFIQSMPKSDESKKYFNRNPRHDPARPSLEAILKNPNGIIDARTRYGYQVKEIAIHLGLHRNTVSRQLCTAGVKSETALSGDK
jgi:putative transposase